jgi:hypothetical protein
MHRQMNMELMNSRNTEDRTFYGASLFQVVHGHKMHRKHRGE